MRWSDAGWLARLVVGLILTLGGDVISSRALACGDAVNRWAEHPVMPGQPAGCSGPTCSRPDPAPLAPHNTPRLAAPKILSHLPQTTDLDPPARSGWLRSADDAPPAPVASAIFHPPR